MKRRGTGFIIKARMERRRKRDGDEVERRRGSREVRGEDVVGGRNRESGGGGMCGRMEGNG